MNWYKSECPDCNNVDYVSERESKRTIHCQRCYRHYEFEVKKPFFRGYSPSVYFNQKETNK